jgi:hypothetical protein
MLISPGEKTVDKLNYMAGFEQQHFTLRDFVCGGDFGKAGSDALQELGIVFGVYFNHVFGPFRNYFTLWFLWPGLGETNCHWNPCQLMAEKDSRLQSRSNPLPMRRDREARLNLLPMPSDREIRSRDSEICLQWRNYGK